MKKKYVFNGYLFIIMFILLLAITFFIIGIALWMPRSNILAFVFLIIFGIICWLFMLYIFVISLQTVKTDEEGIIQQNPLRDAVIIKWENVKIVKIIKFIFKTIYISENDLSEGEMLHLSPYVSKNKLIRLGYSKKMLEEIKKYYNGKILNKGELC